MPKIGAKVSKVGAFVIKKQTAPAPPKEPAKPVKPSQDLIPTLNYKTIVVKNATPLVSKESLKAARKVYDKSEPPKKAPTSPVASPPPKTAPKTSQKPKMAPKSAASPARASPRSEVANPVIARLADAADREILRAQDLIRFPEILKRQGISPSEVSHSLAQQADQLNRERINTLLTTWDGVKVL